jgi:hypothetical protein
MVGIKSFFLFDSLVSLTHINTYSDFARRFLDDHSGIDPYIYGVDPSTFSIISNS